MRVRAVLSVGVILLLALVLQTTLISQLEFFTPDLVALAVILLALTRTRPEVVLGVAFAAGVVVDLVGSSLVGLRAIVFTLVVYIALRTKERAEVGRIVTAAWAGVLSLLGVALLMLVGTLFGQASLMGSGFLSRLVLVPLANLVIASLLAPLFVRLVDRDTTAFRYT